MGPAGEKERPSAEEFLATHLERWLTEREDVQESVVTWVVRTGHLLEGLPADCMYEIVES